MAVFYNNKQYFIYAHINKINNKAYIGITLQTKAKYRWGRDGAHYKNQPKFYNAIKKYGWNNFDHIVLEENIPGEKIAELEKYYILRYNSYQNGYNATPGGEHECRYQSTCRPIYQCTLLDNTIVNEFNSIADAARWIELNTTSTSSHKRLQQSIGEICNNKYENRKSYLGYVWCFKENYNNQPEYHTARGDKRVLQYTLDHIFIKEWLSVSEAEKTLGIHNIGSVCNGKRQKAGGYYWEFKNHT